MITTRIIISLLVLTFVPVASVTAQVYQYTDKNGNMVFTDRPPEGSNAGEIKMNNDRVFRSAPRRAEPSTRTTLAPAEEQRRKRDISDVNVVMYMTSW